MAASGQLDQLTPSAEVVGHAFARQYYTILHQSPGLVYRFYQDMSKLGRVDDNGTMGSTTTMAAINEKIQSYGNLMAEIISVDAQESFNSGVIVLITGVMIKKDNSKRSFTQTFFLAPQDKGYFVMNDIFRYMEMEDEHIHMENEITKDASVESITHDNDSSSVNVENISERQEEVEEGHGWVAVNPSQNGEGSGGEEEEPVAGVDKVMVDHQLVIESNTKVEEVPKKSYASIVMVVKESVPSTPALPRFMVKKQEQEVIAAPSPTSATETSFSSVNVVDDGYNQEVEVGDGCSVYLKNLPLNAIPSMVEEAFKSFGAIKTGGIQVRTNKGFCFGFVEFKIPSSAQNAIEASPVLVGGRQVGVEEKKSTSRGNGRERYLPGRGGAFRSEGTRSRGSYGGGRGYVRGDIKNGYSKNEYESRSGGRGFQNRSNDGYQRNDQMGNGGGRASRAGAGAPAMNAVARVQRVVASA
ncbi:hypothetical protein Dimus_032128 [Dionaea muscipula]